MEKVKCLQRYMDRYSHAQTPLDQILRQEAQTGQAWQAKCSCRDHCIYKKGFGKKMGYSSIKVEKS